MSIEGQGNFLTFAQGHLHMKIKTGFYQKPVGYFKPNFVCKLSGTRKLKFKDMMLVTWPRWLPSSAVDEFLTRLRSDANTPNVLKAK